MYRSYNVRPLPVQPRRNRSKRPLVIAISIIVILAVYTGYALLRTLPAPTVTIQPPVTPALVRVNTPWPASSPNEQAAFGADGYGLLTNHGPETPAPTASVAKVITALAVLDKKPITPGSSGPTIQLTASDKAIYDRYVSIDGSVVPVSAGQTMTEYEALQALMLPSANNIADSLALWAFGSMDAYNAYANTYVKKLGLKQTTVTDASGFAPTTVSTASDLVRLGDAALDNPILKDIVSQRSADTVDFGRIYNVNALLGQSGVSGIKTGNTDEAGGCFLGAATIKVGDQTLTVITAVMKAPSLAQALRDTLPLVQSGPSQFQSVHVVTEGQKLGVVRTAWGGESTVSASRTVAVTAWSGTTISPKVTQQSVSKHPRAGGTVGTVSVEFNGSTKSSDLILSSDVPAASPWWRLTHLF